MVDVNWFLAIEEPTAAQVRNRLATLIGDPVLETHIKMCAYPRLIERATRHAVTVRRLVVVEEFTAW